MDNQITDNSCVDDSITIHATGSTITTKKESSGLRLNWTLVSIVLLGFIVWFKPAYVSTNSSIDEIHQTVNEMRKEIDQSRETNIWLIRWDIISAIDKHEQKGEVSENELKHLTEEIEYYKNKLNGNHGVDERWAGFRSKIFSGSVKVSK